MCVAKYALCSLMQCHAVCKSQNNFRGLSQTAPAAEEPLKNRLRTASEPLNKNLKARFIL